MDGDAPGADALRIWQRNEDGQALVELSLAVIPIVMLLLFGVIEFGTVFHHGLTIAAATREGARAGGAFANGGGPLGCGSGQSPNAATVDPNVVAAVERVLTGNALVRLQDVSEIRIWKSTAAGAETANEINRWVYTPGAGPVVGGERLDFSPAGADDWRACERSNATPADSIGVTVRYTYRTVTPLGWLVPGLASLSLEDRTVMPLNASR